MTNVTANDSSAGGVGGGKGPDGRYFGQKVDQDQDSAPLLCVSLLHQHHRAVCHLRGGGATEAP